MNGISVASPNAADPRTAPRPERHDGRTVSSNDLNQEIAFAGQRVKQKVIFALTMASVIPLLILTYAFQAPVRQMLGPIAQYTEAFTMPALLIFTGLLMAGGGVAVWDLASALSPAAPLAPAPKAPQIPRGPNPQSQIRTPLGA